MVYWLRLSRPEEVVGDLRLEVLYGNVVLFTKIA